MTHEFNRRATDRKLLDIEAMIAAEDDPKQRSFLICLNSINASLMANTSATAQLASQFQEHIEAFEEKVVADEKIMNQGRGAWRVLAWVFGIAQAIVTSAIVYAASDLRDVHAAIQAGQIVDAKMDARISTLEKSK